MLDERALRSLVAWFETYIYLAWTGPYTCSTLLNGRWLVLYSCATQLLSTNPAHSRGGSSSISVYAWHEKRTSCLRHVRHPVWILLVSTGNGNGYHHLVVSFHLFMTTRIEFSILNSKYHYFIVFRVRFICSCQSSL